MAKFLGLEWAPLNIPFERRLQTMWVAIYLNMILPFSCFALIIITLMSSYWYLCVLYLTWVVYDIKINRPHVRGGRGFTFVRKFGMFRHFCNYFPIHLVKTADLDPKKNYIFGVHPHGIISCGAYGNFGSEHTGFREKFPGIKAFMLTLTSHFMIPFSREVLLFQGLSDSSRECVEYILTKKGTGNAVIIVVGGAEEALDAKPERYRLTVHKRKGFIKLAIKTGSSLVPIFSFGENEIFKQLDNPQGSWLRSFQKKFKQIAGLSPPIFYGRGIFNYSFGILPVRKPIFTVVGKPIEVEKMEQPTSEMIEKYHKIYLDELNKLFESEKSKYGVREDNKLQFI